MENRLVWRDDWNMNIPELDKQHIALFNQLNRIALQISQEPELLHSAPTPVASPQENGTQNPSVRQQCSNELRRFLQQIRLHFDTEELLMDEVGFPDIIEHRRDHAMLIAELQQLIWEISQNRETCYSILNEIKDWYVAHVTMDGKDFADFYHAADFPVQEAMVSGKKTQAANTLGNVKS